MPPRKVGERRRARNADTEEAIDKGPQISVNLVPYNVMYRVFLSQLALIPFFTASVASLDRNTPVLNLNQFHPAIFNILVQWLSIGTIWPLYEHSFPTSGSVPTVDVLNVTLTLLFDASGDGNLTTTHTARKLIEAYFMGQTMRAHHFMDAILNLIVRHLHMDSPPLPIHIQEVYSRSSPGLHGLKKLLVDAWVWADRISNGQIPRLSNYLPEFQEHVNITIMEIHTKRYPFDSANAHNPRNSETMDVEINFQALENCLCHGNQGRLKCRYHVHPSTEPCWNLIVDDTPVAW